MKAIPHRLVRKINANIDGSAKILSFAWNGPRKSSLDSVYFQKEHGGVAKSYSPVGIDPTLDLLVKDYKSVGPGDGLGNALCDMHIGESALLTYKTPKVVHGEMATIPNRWKHLVLCAAGTGVAPMYRIADSLVTNPTDKTKISFILSYPRKGDVLMRGNIDDLVVRSGGRAKYYETLTQEPNQIGTALGVSEGRGRLDLNTLHRLLPSPGPGVMVMLCGTDPFISTLAGPRSRGPPDPVTGAKGPKLQGPVEGYLCELGYTAEMVYKM